MATPEFILQLRASAGHQLLFLPGVSAVVLDDDGRILLGRRSDSGRWSVLSGIPEPGEQPALLNPSSRKLRVLLVEDNTVNQLVARAILEKAGHQVDVVDDGRKAIEAVQSKTYDVALMDIQMSGLDGTAATALIRALPPPACAIPIIALTANALAGAREEYLSAGMDGYISKPFDPPELLATLDRIAASPSP